MADLSAVIALLALGAITAHVTEAATGIASLAATAVASAITSGEATTTAIASSVSTSGAVACNVADFTAFVALLAGTAGTAGTARTAAGAAESATRLSRRAVTRHVSGGTAVVAGLLLRCLGAFAGKMPGLPAIVAGWGAFRWAVPSLMGRIATVVAGATVASAVFHVGL
jgi:hypothetical protein